MLDLFGRHLETFLNEDPELGRRLAGFRTFSGVPDGHYQRARNGGASSLARAVKCYPFGGKSLLGDGGLIQIETIDSGEALVVHLKNGRFQVKDKPGGQCHLAVRLPRDLLLQTLLGRHRWVWVLGMEMVSVTAANHLPHSDWVTLLEILVAMQELAEFEAEIWNLIANK